MTSLQYYCILGLAEIKTLHPRDRLKLCAKDAGCAGNKITAHTLHLGLSIFRSCNYCTILFSALTQTRSFSFETHNHPLCDQRRLRRNCASRAFTICKYFYHQSRRLSPTHLFYHFFSEISPCKAPHNGASGME